jgi:hypothetical protein
VKSEQVKTNDLLVNAIIERLCALSSQMVILFDHDGLAATTAFFERLGGNGYDVYDYADNLSLYFYLENKRQVSPGVEKSKVLIRISADLADNAQLPYSVLINSEAIHLRLDDYFEGISAKAVKELPSQYYDKLFDLLRAQPQNLSSYNESIDFITRRVFGIDITGIGTEVQYWAVLFKMHYTDTELPKFVVSKLLNGGTGLLDSYDLDLDQALRSREYFYAFLQKEWQRFVEERTGQEKHLMILPFDHPDLKIYTDNFFAEGLLQRISLDTSAAHDLGWMACGITHKVSDEADKIDSLISSLRAHLPETDCSYKAWQKYVKDYAELLFKLFSSDSSKLTLAALDLMGEANVRFRDWMLRHYDSLASLPSREPVMVHQIAKSMAFQRAENASTKTALIVMDGMSYDQWLCIKAELELGAYNLHEDALFAWAPTLTPISRQSIFSASIPFYFGQSLNSTAKEAGHWKRFWEDSGLTSQSVHYLRMDGIGDIASELEQQINLKSASVIGIVLNVIDDIMHGMNLGSAGMHSQIRHWVKQGHFSAFLKVLIDQGFEVWITSDHGNLECEGIGNIPDGALSETRASRVRIYQSEDLRNQAAIKSENSLARTPKGLPGDIYCLFAPYQAAFHAVGKRIVAHGGISLEEIMVPLVKINRMNK